MRIRKGVKLLEEEEGRGDVVQRQREYIVSIRMSLNRGEILIPPPLSFRPDARGTQHEGFFDHRTCISRDWLIPGLFYALQGMRIGGYRKVVISPHLAYGDKGWQDMIPPNATLIAEIKVLEEAVPKRKRRELEAMEAGMLTQDQLCLRYQITPLMLWRWRKAGRFPAPIVIGRTVRWKPSTIEQWEANGRPPICPSLDELNEKRELAFGHLTLLLCRQTGPADRPPPASSSRLQEQTEQRMKDIDNYTDQMLDLMLELALLIDEAGQWYGPPLETVLNDRAAAECHSRDLFNVIEKIVSA